MDAKSARENFHAATGPEESQGPETTALLRHIAGELSRIADILDVFLQFATADLTGTVEPTPTPQQEITP